MLEMHGLYMTFGCAPAIAGIDIVVEHGKFVVVLGPSGCGKTTLLRIAAGVLAPTSGCIANSFKRSAMVFQEPRLIPWGNAIDNAAFGLKALGFGRSAREQRARDILVRLGFGEADLCKRPSALSGGMRQRVAVARALAIEPELLLMDEPFASLDVGLRGHMQDLVRHEVDRVGLAALFVTHDIAEAVRLASRILVLSPRPARIVADLPNTPVRDPSRIYEAVAALLRHAEIAAALFMPLGEETR